jgi:tetratricopeptide (TPR) repeat protein
VRAARTGPDHLALGDLGEPDCVEPVGLRPARHVLDVLGVDQPRIQVLGFEQASKTARAKRRPSPPRRPRFLRSVASSLILQHLAGRVARDQWRFADAEQAYRQALELLLEFDDRHRAAGTYDQLGRVAQEQRRFADAEQAYRQALKLLLEFDDRHRAALTYHQPGNVAQEQGGDLTKDQLAGATLAEAGARWARPSPLTRSEYCS